MAPGNRLSLPSESRAEDNERLRASDTDDDYNSAAKLPAQAPRYEDENCYFMGHKNRGICMVFNHEKFSRNLHLNQRIGTHRDVERIKTSFGKLGFQVIVCNDYKYKAIKQKIKKLRKRNYTDDDALVIIVLTHGLNERKIHAYDTYYDIKDIHEGFTAKKCATLAGKPKIFFFSACRGDKRDSGVVLQTVERTETDGAKSCVIPNEADFLFGFSTVPGYVSHREPSSGTLYIQSLCDNLDKYASTYDLLDILTKTALQVAKEMSSPKQVPEVHSRLLYSLHL